MERRQPRATGFQTLRTGRLLPRRVPCPADGLRPREAQRKEARWGCFATQGGSCCDGSFCGLRGVVFGLRRVVFCSPTRRVGEPGFHLRFCDRDLLCPAREPRGCWVRWQGLLLPQRRFCTARQSVFRRTHYFA